MYGKVRGKGRPRFGRGHTYTPATTVEYEKLIQQYFLTSKRIKHEGAVGIEIDIHTKKLISKPDIDNICKICLDSLNGLAYNDDTQVVRLIAYKVVNTEEKLIITTYDI